MRLDHNECQFVVNYLRDPYNQSLQIKSMSGSSIHYKLENTYIEVFKIMLWQ